MLLVTRVPFPVFIVWLLIRFVFWMVVISAVIFGVCMIAHGQELPSTPVNHAYLSSPSVRAEIATDFTLRGLDAFTTTRNVDNSCECMHEDVLPASLAASHPGMYLYSFGVAGASQVLAYELWKHHHSRLAFVARNLDSFVESPAVVNNFIVYSRRK